MHLKCDKHDLYAHFFGTVRNRLGSIRHFRGWGVLFSIFELFAGIMAPKRKTEDLKLKSIWDETLVTEVMDNKVHRNKMWQWLVLHPDKDICDVPFASWRVKKASADAILKNFVKYTATVVERNESIRGDTTKLLLELQDGHRIETVIMRHPSHSTVCVSSQIGCQMGCRYFLAVCCLQSPFSYRLTILGFVRRELWESLGT